MSLPGPTLFLDFILLCLMIEATPGPNMGSLALVAMRSGLRAGMMMVVGISVGLSVVALVSALGGAVALTHYPWLGQGLRVAGACYLFWLAWEAWQTADIPYSVHTQPESRYMRQGLVLNLLNPKAMIFYAVVMPRFAQDQLPLWPQLAILSAVSVAIATLMHSGIALLASRGHGTRPRWMSQRRIHRLFAVLLGLVALWFLLG